MLLAAALVLIFVYGCDRNPISGSKLTPANYDQVTMGMSKAQVEKILGPPTSTETKDMIIFKKTTVSIRRRQEFCDRLRSRMTKSTAKTPIWAVSRKPRSSI